MKRYVKLALSRIAPVVLLLVVSSRARRHSQRLERQWGYSDLARRVLRECGPRVTGGPFEGLEFTPRTFDRHISPKLFGSYEESLHPVFDQVLCTRYSEVLDVGCADGYYAVGLARRMPGVVVHAFDTDPWARRTVREMARVNGTENLRVHGACDPDWLARNLGPRAFILSDCEGYEDALFLPDRVPALRSADLLIELHEGLAPGVTDRLLARFADTHSCTVIDDRPRSPEDYPASAFLPAEDRHRALNEVRTDGLRWMFLAAKP
ncbi:MAG TPA: hypothetical protein VHG51_17295 [Longimicrobiaceae bacterium]|nr:hypothetical protein [Longimicrobiaceae bacterium]